MMSNLESTEFDEFFDEFCLGYDEGPDESWILFHDPDDGFVPEKAPQ